MDSQLFQHYVMKRFVVFVALRCLCPFVKTQLTLCMRVYIWAFPSVLLIIFHQYSLSCLCLYNVLKLGSVTFPDLFSFGMVLGIPGV